jgi:hypothetical protein
MNDLLGQKIDLNRVDSNDPLGIPVSGEIVKSFHNAQKSDGFFLLKLDKSFEHDGIDNRHILFWSPLMHRKKDVEEQVDALLLLIPDMKLLDETEIDENAFIPLDWAKVTRTSLIEQSFSTSIH